MAALRAARNSLQLLAAGRAGWAAQQSSSFSSLALGSWWQGTTSPAVASAAALGWQRVAALVPSLADVQLLAVPKKKARAGNEAPVPKCTSTHNHSSLIWWRHSFSSSCF